MQVKKLFRDENSELFAMCELFFSSLFISSLFFGWIIISETFWDFILLRWRFNAIKIDEILWYFPMKLAIYRIFDNLFLWIVARIHKIVKKYDKIFFSFLIIPRNPSSSLPPHSVLCSSTKEEKTLFFRMKMWENVTNTIESFTFTIKVDSCWVEPTRSRSHAQHHKILFSNGEVRVCSSRRQKCVYVR